MDDAILGAEIVVGAIGYLAMTCLTVFAIPFLDPNHDDDLTYVAGALWWGFWPCFAIYQTVRVPGVLIYRTHKYAELIQARRRHHWRSVRK